MPRGFPKAAVGAARASSGRSVWDGFAASALVGMLQRNNQSSAECVAAAASAADRMMEEREKRFAVPPAAQDEAAE